MYLLIAIVFIAELIITCSIISLLRRADRAVLGLNAQVISSRSSIEKIMADFKCAVKTIVNGIDYFAAYVRKKREEYILKIIKTILVYSLIFIIEKNICTSKKCKNILGYGKTFLKRLLDL